MKTSIHSTDFKLDETTREPIRRKLKLALSRMESGITTTSMHLSNIDDLGHGNNKHCSLNIPLTHMLNVAVEDIQKDLLFVIDRVIQTASRTINRKPGGDK